MTRRHHRFGYTLTELLIVLAIIAMLSGLAIPAVVKIGGFLSKKSDLAARDLYGALRAARMSAVSYRNDIAVVYALHARYDNYTKGQSYVLDGFGTARRATPAQIEQIKVNYPFIKDVLENPSRHSRVPLQADDIFILATEPGARFQKMPNGTAIIGHLTAQEEQTLRASGFIDEPPQSVVDFVDGLNDPQGLYRGLTSRGMRMIYLFMETDTGPQGIVADVPLETGDPTIDLPIDISPYTFPAHVFLPTGELGAPGSSLARNLKERITIDVGPAPDAALEDRFTVSPQEGVQPVMAAPVRVELYRSTGRVQIAS